MKTENRKQPDENQDQPRVAVVSIAPSLHARDMTRQFVSEDALSLGGSQPAQRALARKLGISHYTLRNLASGGLKRVCVDLYAKLKAEQIRRLSQSLAKAEHEIAIARSIGLDPRSPEFRALEAAAEAARKVMEEV